MVILLLLLLKVYKKMGLSPGHFTIQHALKLMHKRKLQHQRESSREQKKKRLLRKNEYATVEAASAVCEGMCLKSSHVC